MLSTPCKRQTDDVDIALDSGDKSMGNEGLATVILGWDPLSSVVHTFVGS